MPPKKRSKRKSSHEGEMMSTQAQPRSPEMELGEAAGVEELVVGVEDPLEMSDTEQGDIALETQQDSHIDDDIADT